MNNLNGNAQGEHNGNLSLFAGMLKIPSKENSLLEIVLFILQGATFAVHHSASKVEPHHHTQCSGDISAFWSDQEKYDGDDVSGGGRVM